MKNQTTCDHCAAIISKPQTEVFKVSQQLTGSGCIVTFDCVAAFSIQGHDFCDRCLKMAIIKGVQDTMR